MNMNFFSNIDAHEREFGRYMASQTFYEDPLKWIGKRMLGKGVYLVYMVIPLVLYFWYYYVFIRWRDK